MINAAIVGLGWWGKTLVESLPGSDAMRFVAGTTRTVSAETQAFARQHELRLAASYEALLADPQVDAVVLATPPLGHRAQVIAAAQAGKHVFCEKPFTFSKGDAEAAVQAVRKARVALALGYNRRFHPEMAKLRERIRSGALGTILHVECTMTVPNALFLKPAAWRANRAEAPCGGLAPLGVHAIDAMIDLCGEIGEVYCVNTRRAAPLVDDTTTVTLVHRNGVTSSFNCSLATAPNYRVAVYGTRGLAETDRNLGAFRFSPAPDKPGHPPPVQPEIIDHKGANPLKAGLEAFAAAIRGDAPFPISAEQIVHGVAVFEAIVKSAKTGRPVKVG